MSGETPQARSRWRAAVAATILVAGAASTIGSAAATSLPPWVPLAMLLTTLFAVAGALLWRRKGGSERPGITDPAVQGPRKEPMLDRFQIDVGGRRRIVRAEDIEWFEAKGNYARLHLVDDDYLYRSSLARLERELDPTQFLRVHRSAIVNVEAVRGFKPLPTGDAELMLESGSLVRMSRRYADSFHRATGRPR